MPAGPFILLQKVAHLVFGLNCPNPRLVKDSFQLGIAPFQVRNEVIPRWDDDRGETLPRRLVFYAIDDIIVRR